MAVVAVAAIGAASLVAPGHASTVLGDFFSLLPVAEQLAIPRPFDGLEIGSFDGLRTRRHQRLAGCIGSAAGCIRFVLLQAIDLGDALIAERGLHHLGRQGIDVRRPVDGGTAQYQQRCGHGQVRHVFLLAHRASLSLDGRCGRRPALAVDAHEHAQRHSHVAGVAGVGKALLTEAVVEAALHAPKLSR
ncbi:hypothetical protein SDC9_170875 [bioreactor metagenome]|uniref:Uncharacterized protein n=1 Tax=bioreactor metagenome TaxID=1076179 RepID=A0A645G9A3_9ZZZZ